MKGTSSEGGRGDWCNAWYIISSLKCENENSRQTKDFELLKLREDLVKLKVDMKGKSRGGGIVGAMSGITPLT